MFNHLYKQIDNKKAKILVIGLGYVGLPLLKLINKKKFNAFGLDVNSKKINMIKKSNKNLNLFSNYFDIDFKKIDVIIIALPTPIDSRKNPDLSYLVDCISKLKKLVSKTTLII